MATPPGDESAQLAQTRGPGDGTDLRVMLGSDPQDVLCRDVWGYIYSCALLAA